MSVAQRLKKLGIVLPTPAKPLANYVGAVRMGNALFLAGHIPIDAEGKPSFRGKVGREISAEEGYQAARLVGINLLGTTHAALGGLEGVRRVVKAFGMVNAAPGFVEIPKVVNGFSDLMVEVFGPDVGRHARSAVGVAELPLDVPVEIEMIVEVA